MSATIIDIAQSRKSVTGAVATRSPNAYNRSNNLRGTDLGREAEWIRQIADHANAEAFEELFRHCQRRLFAYLYKILRNRENAEEALNDTMMAVWKSAKKYQGRSRPLVWLFGIARHKALNKLRGSRLMEDELVNGQFASSGHGPEIRLMHQDLVRKGLKRLSPEQREVMELTFFEGFSYREIAEIVDCPENTVKTRMFHAKKNLRGVIASLAPSKRSGT